MLVSIPFEISFSGFANFFLGMVTGIILFTTFLTFFFLRGRKIDISDIKVKDDEIDKDVLLKTIKNRQVQVKKNLRQSDDPVNQIIMSTSLDLIDEISRYFFPNSKYPKLELSIQEFLNLTHYISDRVEEIMNVPVFRNFKNVRIIQIVKLYEKQKYIRDSKFAESYKVYKYTMMVVNVVNPVYWFRKLVINTSIDAMTRKVCSVIIGIVGEESTKIYSKKVFDKSVSINVVEEALEEIMNEAGIE